MNPFLRIQALVAEPDESLPVIPIRVDRQKLAKRLWRGKAEDGTEFGLELETPVKDGGTIWQTGTARYVIAQDPEPVLQISLAVAPSAAAGIGWAIGNLHLELSAEAERLLTLDDPAVRRLLDRLQVPYQPTSAVFRPGRFVRNPGATYPSSHDIGPSHRH